MQDIDQTNYAIYYKKDPNFMLDVIKRDKPPFEFKMLCFNKQQEKIPDPEFFSQAEFEEKLVERLAGAEEIDIRTI